MPHPTALDVSVVIAFADAEDIIGTAVRRLADHLNECRVRFEIIAVDEDSGDNSRAILALLRNNIKELRVISGLTGGRARSLVGRGRGIAVGASRARGHVLWLIEPKAAMCALAPFGRAYRRIRRGETDLVVVQRRFTVCHRTKSLAAIEGLTGRGDSFQRRLLKRAAGRGLGVDSLVIGGVRTRSRSLERLFGAVTPTSFDRFHW